MEFSEILKEPTEIKIFDITGRINKSVLIPAGVKNYTCNINELSDGIYFVQSSHLGISKLQVMH